VYRLLSSCRERNVKRFQREKKRLCSLWRQLSFFSKQVGGGRKVFNLLILYWPWFFFSPYILSFICTVVIWNSWLASYLEIWFVFHPLMCEGNLALNKYRNFVDKEKVYEGRERLLFLKTVDKHKKIKFIWVRK